MLIPTYEQITALSWGVIPVLLHDHLTHVKGRAQLVRAEQISNAM